MLFEKSRFLKNSRFKAVLEACFAELIRCSRSWACFVELIRRFPFSAAQVLGGMRVHLHEGMLALTWGNAIALRFTWRLPMASLFLTWCIELWFRFTWWKHG